MLLNKHISRACLPAEVHDDLLDYMSGASVEHRIGVIRFTRKFATNDRMSITRAPSLNQRKVILQET